MPASRCWRTPPRLLHLIAHEVGPFVLDACADAENTVAPIWIDYHQDTISTDWRDHVEQHGGNLAPGSVVWMNPPYGQPSAGFAGTGAFVARAAAQADQHRITVAVLTEARTDAGWWAQAAALANETRLLLGRVAHLRPDGSVGESPRSGHSLFIFDGRRVLGRGRIVVWDWKGKSGAAAGVGADRSDQV